MASAVGAGPSGSGSGGGSAKATRRVARELAALRAAPFPGLRRIAEPKTIYQLHFLVAGPSATPYEHGEYVFEMSLPSDYPLAPPSLRCLTPSGRFQVSKNICTTFTSYHPESWSPVYTFESILVSLVSLMADDEQTKHIGGVHPLPTAEERRILAAASAAYNAREHAALFQDGAL